jgi:acetyl-CoA synthetase
VDEHFNIAEACCGRWARTEPRTALYSIHTSRAATVLHSYQELQKAADALSQVLAGLGVQRGDRVAIVMPQRLETAVAYMAVFQMGAVAMPLSMLFGPEALEYRLQDSDAVVAICDESSIDSLKAIRGHCPALRTVIAAGTAQGKGDVDYSSALAAQKGAFTAVKTKAEEGAILIYTSGTTGPPKGALLPHRALIGNLPGFICSHNWFGFDGKTNKKSDAVFWSPADWAWTGGLMDALLPSLYFGRPIVAFQRALQSRTGLQPDGGAGRDAHLFVPHGPQSHDEGLSQTEAAFQADAAGHDERRRSGGRCRVCLLPEQLGVTVNEMFGQTEMNYVVGNCSLLWPARPGSMGKAYPGHRVAVIDDEGHECAVGVPGRCVGEPL